MQRRILVIDGHPDPAAGRFLHALAEAYREGAVSAQHQVRRIRVADLEFSLVRTQAEYEHGEPADTIRRCQAEIEWATHVGDITGSIKSEPRQEWRAKAG